LRPDLLKQPRVVRLRRLELGVQLRLLGGQVRREVRLEDGAGGEGVWAIRTHETSALLSYHHHQNDIQCWAKNIRHRRIPTVCSSLPPSHGLADQPLELVQLGNDLPVRQDRVKLLVALRTQSFDHLALDEFQGPRGPPRDGREAGGEVVAADFVERVAEGCCEELLQAGGARAGGYWFWWFLRRFGGV